MARTRLSARGQVVLPKEIRDRLHLERGQELAVEIISGTVVLRPLESEGKHREATWRDLAGCLQNTNVLADLLADHRREIEIGRQSSGLLGDPGVDAKRTRRERGGGAFREI
ncbi:MAG: AbrB/MazE/SpoVT family DNA-binding domain-containing protein [Candidatus Dormibacteraceae bacterium]